MCRDLYSCRRIYDSKRGFSEMLYDVRGQGLRFGVGCYVRGRCVQDLQGPYDAWDNAQHTSV